MPRIRKPHSAIDRLVFLKKSVETAQNETEENLLSTKTLNKATSIIKPLEVGLGILADKKGSTQKEIREKNTSSDIVQTYVRDIWAGLRRRVYRENLALDVFAHYQLPKSGNSPKLASDGQWIETALLIVSGEAAAVAKGFAPMTNPTIEELSAKIAEAQKEAADVSVADKNLDVAQEAVSSIMPEASMVIDRIIAELNFNLYEKDDAGRRRTMRNYGVKYEVTNTETSEDISDVILN